MAWTRLDLSENGLIKEAVKPAGAAFSAPRGISPQGEVASEPALAAVPGPGVAFAWTQVVGEDGEAVQIRVEAAGVPFANQSVPGGGDTSDARLATDPAGTLHVAWIRTTAAVAEVLVSARNGAGAIDAPQMLSPGEAATKLDFAFSLQGDAAVAWNRFIGDPDDPGGEIRAVVFDAPRNPGTLQPPPQPAPPPPLPPPVAAAPVLGLDGFGVSPSCIRYGEPFDAPRRRLRFTFALSEPATVVLTIERRLNSAAQRRCPAKRVRGAPGRFGPPIVLQLPSGAGRGELPVGDEGQAFAARMRPAPRTRVLLRRRMSPGRHRAVIRQSPTALAPGTYRATITATTDDGRAADTRNVKFWVLASAPALRADARPTP